LPHALSPAVRVRHSTHEAGDFFTKKSTQKMRRSLSPEQRTLILNAQ